MALLAPDDPPRDQSYPYTGSSQGSHAVEGGSRSPWPGSSDMQQALHGGAAAGLGGGVGGQGPAAALQSQLSNAYAAKSLSEDVDAAAAAAAAGAELWHHVDSRGQGQCSASLLSPGRQGQCSASLLVGQGQCSAPLLTPASSPLYQPRWQPGKAKASPNGSGGGAPPPSLQDHNQYKWEITYFAQPPLQPPQQQQQRQPPLQAQGPPPAANAGLHQLQPQPPQRAQGPPTTNAVNEGVGACRPPLPRSPSASLVPYGHERGDAMQPQLDGEQDLNHITIQIMVGARPTTPATPTLPAPEQQQQQQQLPEHSKSCHLPSSWHDSRDCRDVGVHDAGVYRAPPRPQHSARELGWGWGRAQVGPLLSGPDLEVPYDLKPSSGSSSCSSRWSAHAQRSLAHTPAPASTRTRTSASGQGQQQGWGDDQGQGQGQHRALDLKGSLGKSRSASRYGSPRPGSGSLGLLPGCPAAGKGWVGAAGSLPRWTSELLTKSLVASGGDPHQMQDTYAALAKELSKEPAVSRSFGIGVQRVRGGGLLLVGWVRVWGVQQVGVGLLRGQ